MSAAPTAPLSRKSASDPLSSAGSADQGGAKGPAGAAGELAGQFKGLATAAPTLAAPPQENSEEGWTITTEIYRDPEFPKTTVAKFLRGQVPEWQRKTDEDLVDILFNFANENLQKIYENFRANPNNRVENLTFETLQAELNKHGRQRIKNALEANINASAANMVFINTIDGPFLMAVETRKTYGRGETLLALQVSNGPALGHGSLEEGCNHYCKAELFGSEVPNNHISRVALGQPSQLFPNCQIPSDPLALVSQIILAPNCLELYVNACVAKMNEKPISLAVLKEEVKALNDKLNTNARKIAYYAAKELRSALGKLSGDNAVENAIAMVNEFLDGHGEALTQGAKVAFEKKIQVAQTAQNPINFLIDAIRYGVMDHTQLHAVRLLNVTELKTYVGNYLTAIGNAPNGQIDPISFDGDQTFNAGYPHLAALFAAAKAGNLADLGQGLINVLKQKR